MRHPAIPVLAVLLALLPGCDRVGAIADSASRQAFERRCDALPQGGVAVVRTPNGVAVDRSFPQRDLERLAESASPQHRTLGLTRASFGYRSTIELDGLEDARGGRACAHPRVRVEVELGSMTVYVAREYRGDACREPLILEHEQRHVAVFEQYADEAARKLADELGARVGRRVRYGSTMAGMQDALKADLSQWLDAFMARSRDELAVRNAAVDTADEYEKLARACGPAP